MPKIAIIAIIVVAVLAAVGYFFLKGNSPLSQVMPNSQQTSTLSGVNPNQPMICEYSDDNFQTTAYIMPGQGARVDGVSASGNTSSIVKGDTSWHWDPATKEGFTMTFEPEKMDDTKEQAGEMMTQEDIDEKVNSPDANCRNENFDTSLLTPPSDVTFQDYSQMMNDQMDKMNENMPQDIKDQIPEEYQKYLPQ